MTEGIIQKVFAKYDLQGLRQNNIGNITYPEFVDKIEELQQELIEEIKKEFPDLVVKPNMLTIVGITNNNSVKRKLIGDSD